MKRESEDVAGRLLATCSACLCTDAGPQGTAFFVSPGYAVTAAHIVGGADGLQVRLTEGTNTWCGHVTEVRPPTAGTMVGTSPFPAPDLALIAIEEGPAHSCALLGHRLPEMGAWVMARGYTQTFDRRAVTAETETFRLSGTLETPDPGCTLLKLGLGEVTKGMSGAPVIELGTAEVIGMLRTSRQTGSNLGGWVVPADVIRLQWPEQASEGNDLFHQHDPRWRQETLQLRSRSSQESPPAQSGLSIGKIVADIVPVITGGSIGTIHIENSQAADRRRRSGEC